MIHHGQAEKSSYFLPIFLCIFRHTILHRLGLGVTWDWLCYVLFPRSLPVLRCKADFTVIIRACIAHNLSRLIYIRGKLNPIRMITYQPHTFAFDAKPIRSRPDS
jgi:hypothetical protein